MNAQTSSQEHPKQEPSDLRPGAVLVGVAGVIATVLLVALMAHLVTRLSASAETVPTREPIARATRLSSNPEEEITAFESEKRSQLESYGWTDRERAFAHIPIEQAMQKLVSEESSHQGQQ